MALGMPHIEKHHFMVEIYIPRHEATFHGISACFSAMDIDMSGIFTGPWAMMGSLVL